jgi:hypothetical protein
MSRAKGTEKQVTKSLNRLLLAAAIAMASVATAEEGKVPGGAQDAVNKCKQGQKCHLTETRGSEIVIVTSGAGELYTVQVVATEDDDAITVNGICPPQWERGTWAYDGVCFGPTFPRRWADCGQRIRIKGEAIPLPRLVSPRITEWRAWRQGGGWRWVRYPCIEHDRPVS